MAGGPGTPCFDSRHGNRIRDSNPSPEGRSSTSEPETVRLVRARVEKAEEDLGMAGLALDDPSLGA